jgi:hypothetical protein
MARYRDSFVSTAAQAGSATAPIYSLGVGATGDALIRRLTLGFTSGGSTPTSQQVQINAQPCTGLTNGTGRTVGVLRSTSRPALVVPSIPTGSITAVGPPFITTLNTQSAADLPWEQLEEWAVPASSWLAIMVITTLPASTSLTLDVEWEE